ncbi:MAG: hypothetical protein IH884_09715 [Myxococcales bacterium]|nr:hypothetical protein [Myxococcales bacterium]
MTESRAPGATCVARVCAAAPTLEIVGVPFAPAAVPSAARTARVTGPAGFEVTLLVVEGGLFTAGVPGGGFDLDPFEANSALLVEEYTAALDATGSVEIPFTLSDTDPDGGIGHIVAALRDGSGLTGPVSNAFVLELVPSNCGDGVPEGGEQCDDGNTEDGDCCSSACQFETAGTICGPGDACIGSSSCDGAGACLAGAPVICDDGQFCNGAESCDIVSGCQAGTPPTLDDGIGCTVDACDEASDSVTHTPDDSACDDALFCNGAETCNAATDCEAGTPPTLDDGVACTVDSCDEAGDQVQNTPDPAACQDADPCTADSCDAIFGCVNDPIPDCTATAVPTGGAPNWLLLALVATAWRALSRPGGARASQR